MPPKRKATATKSEVPEEKKTKPVEDEIVQSSSSRNVTTRTKKKDVKSEPNEIQVPDKDETSEVIKESKPTKRPPAKASKVSKVEDGGEKTKIAEDNKESKRGKGKRAKPSSKTENEGPEGEGVPKKAIVANDKQESGPKGFLNQTETSFDNISFDCKETNKLGKTANIRISSWNVDGIRAWLKKDGLAYLEHEKPDILCLQEIKCSSAKLPPEIKNLKGYKQYWHNSVKEGYAGVSLFSRTEPISVDYGIGEEEHDQEGRCITAEFDKFYVISVYVPNAGRKLVNLPTRLEWNTVFKKFIKRLDKKKPVIICGDMNVAHSEIDLTNPKTNTKNAGFTKEEREGMTDFLSDGYVDTFRSLYPDKKDAYTFWSYLTKARAKNIGWRLDYFIVSKRFADNICESNIRNEVFGSDHCPIVLFLNV